MYSQCEQCTVEVLFRIFGISYFSYFDSRWSVELRCRSGIRAAAKWGKRSRFKTFPSFVGFFFFVSFFSFFFSFVSFVSFFFSFAMSLRSGIGTQDCGKLWKQDETYRDLKPLLPLFSRISLFPFLFFLSNTLFLEKR